ERLIATDAAANAMGAIRANSMPFRQFRVYSGSGAGYRVTGSARCHASDRAAAGSFSLRRNNTRTQGQQAFSERLAPAWTPRALA
ncbi:hypothetical protein, partial [Paraburkholderia hospita]|uniref:hypothetical protein n=1 Tax=Paraburkholderia hospita TaxID=169430 RepID=UPI001A994AD5